MTETEALPTEPHTVIEPHWKRGLGPTQPKVIRFGMTLYEDGNWRGLGWFRTAATLQREITGFTVLAVPVARVGSGAVPPDGWFPFGSHVDFDGPLEFSPELDEGGLPFWERHVGSGAVPPQEERDLAVDFDTEFTIQDALRPRTVPPQHIDRDALLSAIAKAIDENYDEDAYQPVYTEAGEIVDSAAARAVLAVVRPVEGVTLTPEEARLAHEAVKVWTRGMPVPWPSLVALTEKLETMAQGGQ